MWKEFREFAARGNVLDLAVGVILGAAFGKIVTSLVNDVLMPPIGLILGGFDFKGLLRRAERRVVPLARGGPGGERAHDQLRRVREHRAGVSDRGVRDFHAGAADQSNEDACPDAGQGQLARLPVLRVTHCAEGDPVSVLHIGSARGGLTSVDRRPPSRHSSCSGSGSCTSGAGTGRCISSRAHAFQRSSESSLCAGRFASARS